jgi:valyl-tRNA synthetase
MDKYGTDALRAALIFGTKDGGDVSISEEKVVGMRNFTNKIWNIGRFLIMMNESTVIPDQMGNPVESKQPGESSKLETRNPKQIQKVLKELNKESSGLIKKYKKHMDKEEFSKALDITYHFIWHRFADYYIEAFKESIKNGNKEAYEHLHEVYLQVLVLLHPFIPFVTEAVWQVFHGEKETILNSDVLRR